MTSPTIDSLLKDSEIKESTGDLKGAAAAAGEALELARAESGSQVPSRVLLRSVVLAYRMGEYPQGRRLAEEVLSQDRNTPEAVDALVSLGIIEADTNDLQAAEKHFYQAAEISRAIQYPAGLARALHNQAASVYFIEGKFTLALASMEEAHQLKLENNGETWGLPFLQTITFMTMGDRKRAREALDAYLPLVRPGTRIAGGYYYLWS
ncbi:tetratricopeptide repeat protein, partial [bacterium]